MTPTDNGTGNTILNGLFSLARTWTAPLAQKVIYGGQATPNAVVDETAKWAGLNGSGPNDTASAKQAPQGFLDFIAGRNTGQSDTGANAVTKTAASMDNSTKIMLLAVVALVIFLVVKMAAK